MDSRNQKFSKPDLKIQFTPKWDDIKPALFVEDMLNEKEWESNGRQYKMDIINGDLWTDLPEDHWGRSVGMRYKAFTPTGFYTHPDHPGELLRIYGYAPSFRAIIITRKKSQRKVSKRSKVRK